MYIYMDDDDDDDDDDGGDLLSTRKFFSTALSAISLIQNLLWIA